MNIRKPERTEASIDRGWPFQIVLDSALCAGKQGIAQDAFCNGLSLCARGHSFLRGDKTYLFRCFSLGEDADKFMTQFGGEWSDPNERGPTANGKWRSSSRGLILC